MAPRTPWFRNGASSACAKAPLATQSTAKAMRAMRIIAAILHVNGGTRLPSLRSAARTQAESLDGDLRTYPSRPHRIRKVHAFSKTCWLATHLLGYALSRH